MNASSDSYPSVASMPRVSSGLGPIWRVTKRSAGASEARTIVMTLLPDVFLVRLTVQQLLELRGVFHAELDHPARAVGVAIHEGRIALERVVHVGHGAREGRVQLRHGLHGLDRAEHVAPPEDGADLGQVHVHHVPELALRVVGDPDLHDGVGAGLLHVLVLCCVAQIGRNVRHAGVARSWAWEVAAKVTRGTEPLSRQRVGGRKQVGPRRQPRGIGLDQEQPTGAPGPEIEAHRDGVGGSGFLGDPSFSITKSLLARWRSAGICAAIIRSASSFESPRMERSRVRRSAGLASTRTTASNWVGSRASKSRGMSLTTSKSPPARASRSSSSRRRRTAGWTIWLSASSAAWSPITLPRSAARSRLPSAARTSAPNRPAIAASTSPPGAWASRARTSASMIVAPQRWKRSTTVDLPAAILPVRATFNTERGTRKAERGTGARAGPLFRVPRSHFRVQRSAV